MHVLTKKLSEIQTAADNSVGEKATHVVLTVFPKISTDGVTKILLNRKLSVDIFPCCTDREHTSKSS